MAVGPKIAVEVHRYRTDRRSKERPVRFDPGDWTGGVQWSEGVVPPFGGIQLALKLPRSLYHEAPMIGDWIVLRDAETNRALQWGYVIASSGQIERNEKGALSTGMIQLAAIDFWAHASRIQVIAPPGINRLLDAKGTLLSVDEWGAVARALVKRAARGDIGGAMAETWKTLARIRLPASLGGDYLARAIEVVYDADTQLQYGPTITVDPPPGVSVQGLTSAGAFGGMIGDLINGTFVPDLNMVELFPTLAEYGIHPRADPYTAALDARSQTDLEAQAMFKSRKVGEELITVNPITGEPDYRIDAEVQNIGSLGTFEPASNTGKILGRNPVLVYRMCPWRDEAISVMLEQSGPQSLSQIEALIDTSLFDDPTWGNPDHVFPEHHVYSLHWAMNDAEHVNCVTVGLPTQPDHPIAFWQRLGLPIKMKLDIEDHGLRVFRPNWPFFPPIAEDPAQQVEFIRHLRAVAHQALQFKGGAHRFMSGTLHTKYAPTVRAGTVVAAELPPSVAADESERFTGYAERVTHTIQASDDRVHAETTIDYQRGLTRELTRRMRVPTFGLLPQELGGRDEP